MPRKTVPLSSTITSEMCWKLNAVGKDGKRLTRCNPQWFEVRRWERILKALSLALPVAEWNFDYDTERSWNDWDWFRPGLDAVDRLGLEVELAHITSKKLMRSLCAFRESHPIIKKSQPGSAVLLSLPLWPIPEDYECVLW